jgi:hypothetical protein
MKTKSLSVNWALSLKSPVELLVIAPLLRGLPASTLSQLYFCLGLCQLVDHW